MDSDNNPQRDMIINPYQNEEIIKHKKFISHLGISFIDLKYVEKNLFYPPRTILRKICGQINYGTLNGIFGPKKCGKTALLRCLSNRNNQRLEPCTKFFVNPDIPIRVVYLEKKILNNILLSLTVKEMLEYSFLFRDPSVPFDQRKPIIKELIQSLQLQEVVNTSLMNCTVEEQIKSQIAMSLSTFNKPNMIFLEEPFSLLDNVSIENFTTLMKQLTRLYSVAVNFSISQILDSDVLSIFDKLYVLSRGGLCIYEGSAEHMSLFLRESGIIISSKIQTPIERLIKIASKPTELTIRVANRVSSTREDILHFSQKYGILLENGFDILVSDISFQNIWHLFNRSLIHKYRYYWKSTIVHYWTLVGAILLLIMFFEPGIGMPDSCYSKPTNEIYASLIIFDYKNHDKITGLLLRKNTTRYISILQGKKLVDGNLKFLFITTLVLTLFHLWTSCMNLNEEIIVASNEHRNGFININSFIFVKNITNMIVPFINTISCCLISYYFLFPQLLTDYWRFFSFFLSQLFSIICAQSLGLVINVISLSNQRLANIVALFITILLVIFSGYLIPLKNTDHWIQILSEISFIKLSYELTLISFYGLERCQQNVSFVLEEFGIDNEKDYLYNFLTLSIHYSVYCFLFWIILFKRTNKHVSKQKKAPVPPTNPELEIEQNDDKSLQKKF